MKIFTNIEQGSPEWFDLRKCKLTASHGCEIGNNGKGLETYIVKMMAESYSSGMAEKFSNEHLERGIELETQARTLYELENGVAVAQVAFVELNEYVGCSPDGLVGEDGLIEIKSPSDINHFKMILNGEKEVDSKYIWQTQMQMLITGRKWCDLVFYCPNYEKSMIVFRILPDAEKFDSLEKGFAAGIKRIQEIKRLIK